MKRKCLSEDEILRRLADSRRTKLAGEQANLASAEFAGDLRPAAVLLPLLWEEEAWHLLFTHRAGTVEHHRDEVAFPGGTCQAGETPEQTALRETAEETGLAPEDVRILGRLPDVTTGTGYRVTPVVGRIPWPCALRLSPHEVTRVFTIPLDWLAQRRHWRIVPYTPPGGRAPFPVIVYQPYSGEVLWGASARITHVFLATLGIIDGRWTVDNRRWMMDDMR